MIPDFESDSVALNDRTRTRVVYELHRLVRRLELAPERRAARQHGLRGVTYPWPND
jgi:hypothetical protein